MYYDDLPLWGFIGKVDREGKANPEEYKYFIYTRIHFNIFFSGNHVTEIRAQIATSHLADITRDREVEVQFSYDAVWKEVNVSFEKRMDKYSKSAHLLHHYGIHEFAIGNALLPLLFLIVWRLNEVCSHSQLSAEDHRWWWRSFLSGGSSALYIYGYFFYYYFYRSDIRGFMQTSFLATWPASAMVSLMLGTVGFRASLLFVRYIYGSIKCE